MLDKRALSIVEYTILIGIVTAAFVGMQVFFRRSVQAKLKDSTDYFINQGEEHKYVTKAIKSEAVTETIDGPAVTTIKDDKGVVSKETVGKTKRQSTQFSTLGDGWEDLLPLAF